MDEVVDLSDSLPFQDETEPLQVSDDTVDEVGAEEAGEEASPSRLPQRRHAAFA